MSTLSQFVGARILRLDIQRIGTPAGDAQGFGLEVRLADGSMRTVEIYTLTRDLGMHVRIDGMYVPPEEL